MLKFHSLNGIPHWVTCEAMYPISSRRSVGWKGWWENFCLLLSSQKSSPHVPKAFPDFTDWVAHASVRSWALYSCQAAHAPAVMQRWEAESSTWWTRQKLSGDIWMATSRLQLHVGTCERSVYSPVWIIPSIRYWKQDSRCSNHSTQQSITRRLTSCNVCEICCSWMWTYRQSRYSLKRYSKPSANTEFLTATI